MAGGHARKIRVLAAKIETTPGTAVNLAATDGKFNVYDLDAQLDVEFEKREGQGSFDALPGVVTEKKGHMDFKIDLTGSGVPEDGAGEAVPQYAKTFFPSCEMTAGAGAAANTYTKVSTQPGVAATDAKSLTMGCYIDGVKKTLRGAVGTVTFNFQTGKKAFAEFHYEGIWEPVIDVAILKPDHPRIIPTPFVHVGLTVGTYTPRVAEITVNVNNTIKLREDANATSGGYYCGMWVDSKVQGTLDPESTLVASGDPYNDLFSRQALGSGAAMAFAWGGSGAGGNGANGHHIAFALGAVQLRNVQEADRDGLMTDAWEFQSNRVADAGDDCLTITYT